MIAIFDVAWHLVVLVAIPVTLGVLIVLWGTWGPPPSRPIVVDDLGVPHALDAFDGEGDTIP